MEVRRHGVASLELRMRRLGLFGGGDAGTPPVQLSWGSPFSVRSQRNAVFTNAIFANASLVAMDTSESPDARAADVMKP